MRDSDELTKIPPIVPSRDDVDTHQQSRKGQAQDIVRPAYRAQMLKVSTVPVRIMLTVLSLAMLGAGAGAYYLYGEYENDLHQADLRIGDLERRLSLVGNTAEDSLVNIQETMDFHFSEIDKLWAARNKTNEEVVTVHSDIARLALVNEGQDEIATTASKQIADAAASVNASNTRLNTLVSEIDQISQSLEAVSASIASLDNLRTDMQSVQAALNSGDSNILGVIGRLEYVEESMESVNAHRLQINETLFRLQESIEAIQRQVSPAGL